MTSTTVTRSLNPAKRRKRTARSEALRVRVNEAERDEPVVANELRGELSTMLTRVAEIYREAVARTRRRTVRALHGGD